MELGSGTAATTPRASPVPLKTLMVWSVALVPSTEESSASPPEGSVVGRLSRSPSSSATLNWSGMGVPVPTISEFGVWSTLKLIAVTPEESAKASSLSSEELVSVRPEESEPRRRRW